MPNHASNNSKSSMNEKTSEKTSEKMSELVGVVSGANRGIGLEFVKQLLAGGATVFAGVRDPAKAAELLRVFSDHQSRLKIFPLDISSDASVAKFKTQVESELVASKKTLNLLINNAGIYLDANQSQSVPGATADEAAAIPTDKILETFNVNTVGPIRMTRAFLPLLKKSSHSRIASVSSQMGSIGESSGGAIAYRMSKAALNMYVKCVSVEETDVISLTMHPGWVQTEMGGKSAPVKPETSVAGLLKVIMEASAKTSGHFVRYDGKEAPW